MLTAHSSIKKGDISHSNGLAKDTPLKRAEMTAARKKTKFYYKHAT
jgi:hypothetical protein